LSCVRQYICNLYTYIKIYCGICTHVKTLLSWRCSASDDDFGS